MPKPPYEGWELLIETYDDPEATMVKGLLETEGIESAIKSSKVPMYTVNFGKMGVVRLYVQADDLERAKKILAEAMESGEDT